MVWPRGSALASATAILRDVGMVMVVDGRLRGARTQVATAKSQSVISLLLFQHSAAPIVIYFYYLFQLPHLN